MKKFRIGLIIFASVAIIAQLFFLNYNNLSWKVNDGTYIAIISMIFIILSMIMSNKNEKKNKN